MIDKTFLHDHLLRYNFLSIDLFIVLSTDFEHVAKGTLATPGDELVELLVGIVLGFIDTFHSTLIMEVSEDAVEFRKGGFEVGIADLFWPFVL